MHWDHSHSYRHHNYNCILAISNWHQYYYYVGINNATNSMHSCRVRSLDYYDMHYSHLFYYSCLYCIHSYDTKMVTMAYYYYLVNLSYYLYYYGLLYPPPSLPSTNSISDACFPFAHSLGFGYCTCLLDLGSLLLYIYYYYY